LVKNIFIKCLQDSRKYVAECLHEMFLLMTDSEVSV